MTCIVAIKEDGYVYMAGDSFYGSEYWYQLTANPKFFVKDGVMLGLSGSPREYNLLQWSLEIPENLRGDALEYAVRDLVPAIRHLFRDNGVSREVESQELSNSDILLAIDGRLFNLDCDYQVGEVADSYMAVGCGRDYALGSLYTSEGSITNRLTLALNAASKFSPNVCGPFHYGVL